jgi:hypothetical protein
VVKTLLGTECVGEEDLEEPDELLEGFLEEVIYRTVIYSVWGRAGKCDPCLGVLSQSSGVSCVACMCGWVGGGQFRVQGAYKSLGFTLNDWT